MLDAVQVGGGWNQRDVDVELRALLQSSRASDAPRWNRLEPTVLGRVLPHLGGSPISRDVVCLTPQVRMKSPRPSFFGSNRSSARPESCGPLSFSSRKATSSHPTTLLNHTLKASRRNPRSAVQMARRGRGKAEMVSSLPTSRAVGGQQKLDFDGHACTRMQECFRDRARGPNPCRMAKASEIERTRRVSVAAVRRNTWLPCFETTETWPRTAMPPRAASFRSSSRSNGLQRSVLMSAQGGTIRRGSSAVLPIQAMCMLDLDICLDVKTDTRHGWKRPAQGNEQHAYATTDRQGA
ncbi:hypothetical protein L1887_58053 [Cichorium endivia]|nr:hypothetical protein L1887_58053 [Cichorium endivia]